MKLTEEQHNMLALLAGGVGGCGEDQAFKRIYGMGGETLERVVDELSAIERQPGLNVAACKLIAQYKDWLAGKLETEDLRAACLHANGL